MVDGSNPSGGATDKPTTLHLLLLKKRRPSRRVVVVGRLIDELRRRPLTPAEVRVVVKEALEEYRLLYSTSYSRREDTGDAVRRGAGRCIDELKRWGLVEERGGRYYWYIYPESFKRYELYGRSSTTHVS